MIQFTCGICFDAGNENHSAMLLRAGSTHSEYTGTNQRLRSGGQDAGIMQNGIHWHYEKEGI